VYPQEGGLEYGLAVAGVQAKIQFVISFSDGRGETRLRGRLQSADMAMKKLLQRATACQEALPTGE